MRTKRPPAKPTTGVCEALLRLKPGNLDEDAIRTLVGDRVAKDLPEVAAEFGIEATTLRSSWRIQGMPGEPGAWSLVEILLWRLRHGSEMATRKQKRVEGSVSELERRQLEAETRKLELQAEKLEREMEVALGNLIDRKEAAAALKAMLSVIANQMLTMQRDIAPSLPIEQAPRIVAEIERHIRRNLTALSEKSGRQIMQEAEILRNRGAVN